MFLRVYIAPLIDLASTPDSDDTRVSESDAYLLVLFFYNNRSPLLHVVQPMGQLCGRYSVYCPGTGTYDSSCTRT